MDEIQRFLIRFNADEDDLEELDEALDRIWAAGKQHDMAAALLVVFENNPDHDGYGVFHTVLHKLETIDGYEVELYKSLVLRPSRFAIYMANRILNSHPDAELKNDLINALTDALAYPALSQSNREAIQRCLDENC